MPQLMRTSIEHDFTGPLKTSTFNFLLNGKLEPLTVTHNVADSTTTAFFQGHELGSVSGQLSDQGVFPLLVHDELTNYQGETNERKRNNVFSIKCRPQRDQFYLHIVNG